MTAFDHQIMHILTYGLPIWGVPKANKWINLENIPTSVTNVAKYSRYFINSVSETDIYLSKWLNVQRGPNEAHRRLLHAVHFETITNKELFLQHYSKGHYDIVIIQITRLQEILILKKFTPLLQICLNQSKCMPAMTHVWANLVVHRFYNRVWSRAVSYWLRMAQGTENVFFKDMPLRLCQNPLSFVVTGYQASFIYGFTFSWEDPPSVQPKRFSSLIC